MSKTVILKALKVILQIQELDMKMLRLMRLKQDRQKELKHINSIRDDLNKQLEEKEDDIKVLKKNVLNNNLSIAELKEKIKELEAHQNAVKKVEEFNALSQEIAATERQKHHKEQQSNELAEKLASEEERLNSLKKSIKESADNSQIYEKEIHDSIKQINDEGLVLKKDRDQLKTNADGEILKIYERLFCNKMDRVVVPIQKRTCSGCHIVLTAQHENLVRKCERLIFCEHCSRIHYWQESEALEDSVVATKRRRRRRPAATS